MTQEDPSDSLMVKAHQLYDRLSEEACPGHVILDDRTHLTMGARLRDSQRLGYPCTIVIGHKVRDLCLSVIGVFQLPSSAFVSILDTSHLPSMILSITFLCADWRRRV